MASRKPTHDGVPGLYTLQRMFALEGRLSGRWLGSVAVATGLAFVASRVAISQPGDEDKPPNLAKVAEALLAPEGKDVTYFYTAWSNEWRGI